MSYKLIIFDFQIIKSLQATYIDARFSNTHQPAGSQTFIDRRGGLDAIFAIENVTIVARTPSDPRRGGAIQLLLGTHGEDIPIYEIVVCGVIAICGIVILYTLRVILQKFSYLS